MVGIERGRAVNGKMKLVFSCVRFLILTLKIITLGQGCCVILSTNNIARITECFGALDVDLFFMNNIFNLKRNCVLCTLKNSYFLTNRLFKCNVKEFGNSQK